MHQIKLLLQNLFSLMHQFCVLVVNIMIAVYKTMFRLIGLTCCTHCAKAVYVIAEPEGEASNRNALSSPVCMIYVYPSQSTRDT